MELILHPGSGELERLYERAFTEARALYIVSAYLTAWRPARKLNGNCTFQMIIGKDFGLTRKRACRELIKWLPAVHKNDLYVANYIAGFHPKAMFWTDRRGNHHILVGSSNLTEAAFSTNFEVNLYSQINSVIYERAVEWFRAVLEKSRPLDNNWLTNYKEAKLTGKQSRNKNEIPKPSSESEDFIVPGDLREIPQYELNKRRVTIRAFNSSRHDLTKLFSTGAGGALANDKIYERFMRTWGRYLIQGPQWTMKGKKSNWRRFARGIMKILQAKDLERDNAVKSVIDDFAARGLPTRKSLLTELLCTYYPKRYPIINKPVKLWSKDNKYDTPWGSSEGAKYIDMAIKMRLALANSGVANLFELDLLIWSKYNR